MFNKGDFVMCNTPNQYITTDIGVLCVVVNKEPHEEDDIKVKVLDPLNSGISKSEIGVTYWVKSYNFRLIE